MTVKVFSFSTFQTNCYICHDNEEAVLVDPSCANPWEEKVVTEYLERNGLTLRHILLTHAHIDHIFGCAYLTAFYDLPYKMHRADEPLLLHGQEQARMFGVVFDPPAPTAEYLEEGDTISFGESKWGVLLTPGHSPGSICFFDEKNGFVIVGDVLFQGSIGRTDLWKGSMQQLMDSIFNKVIPLGDHIKVYPGHGPATYIDSERQMNPFLRR